MTTASTTCCARPGASLGGPRRGHPGADCWPARRQPGDVARQNLPGRAALRRGRARLADPHPGDGGAAVALPCLGRPLCCAGRPRPRALRRRPQRPARRPARTPLHRAAARRSRRDGGGRCGRMSELLEIRVISAAEVAEQAATRFAELLDVDRCTGPYPSRKTPGLVRYYLTGQLRPTDTGTARDGRAAG